MQKIFEYLTITPITLTYFCKLPYYDDITFGNIIRKALETAFDLLDKENNNKNDVEKHSFLRGKIPENKIHDDPLVKDNVNNPPRGYAFSYEKGKVMGLIDIHINMFGWYNEAIPFLTENADNLFNNIHIAGFEYINSVDYLGLQQVSNGNRLLSKPYQINYESFTNYKVNSNYIKINFLSPCLLFGKHNFNGNMRFNDLIYHLAKRAALLSYLYCDGSTPTTSLLREIIDNEDEKLRVSSINLKWQYEEFGNNSSKICGYTGNVEYSATKDILNNYLAVLLLGEYLQVGEKTNYGAGKYSLAHESYSFI